jgi:acyl-CoA reductase-like NAD-dependent aldehyde dehydrogenase
MTVAEVREIREKKSLEWVNLSPEQRNTIIKKGAKQLQKQIEGLKKKPSV